MAVMHDVLRPANMLERWQLMIDLLASVCGMPYAMINRVDGAALEVHVLNASAASFQAGDRFDLGLNTYCKQVLTAGRALAVESVDLSGPIALDNPTAALGLIAYHGLPIRTPEGALYGTVCVLDQQPHELGEQEYRFFDLVRSFIEQDLAHERLLVTLAQRETEARAAAEEARQSSTRRIEFVMSVNHELQTPLNAVLGYAQLLDMDAEAARMSEAQRGRVRQIGQAASHLSGLIRDLTDLSLADTGRLHLQIETQGLQGILEDAVGQLQPMAQQRGVRLKEPEGDLSARVLGDSKRLRQVVLNVVSNAIKYNRPGGEVGISVRQQDHMVALAIEDNGIGMTQEQLDHLFRPFDRLGRQAGSIEGTGIGLALCQQLLLSMDAEVQVRSLPDQGTTVLMRLRSAAAP